MQREFSLRGHAATLAGHVANGPCSPLATRPFCIVWVFSNYCPKVDCIPFIMSQTCQCPEKHFELNGNFYRTLLSSSVFKFLEGTGRSSFKNMVMIINNSNSSNLIMTNIYQVLTLNQTPFQKLYLHEPINLYNHFRCHIYLCFKDEKTVTER